MKNANKKGFTLIEMLVVVLIIGILAAVALPQYFKAVEKSRATEALSVMGSLANAMERARLVRSDNQYPDDFSTLDIQFTNYGEDTPTNGPTLTTNSFTLTHTGGAVATGQVQAVRNNTANPYTITRKYQAGTITCEDANNSGICASLGLAATAQSTGGSGSGSGS